MKQPIFLVQLSLRGRLSKSLLLLLNIFFYSSACFSQPNILAKKGVLNLTNWSWKNNGIADLNGEWEFYWDTLYDPSKQNLPPDIHPGYISVPGFWNSKVPGSGIFKPAFGYATYRLKVLCPPGESRLELKFLTIASAYKLFVNGKQLLEIGKVGTAGNTSTPDFHPAIIPVNSLDNELNIVIQASNFTYKRGGIWDYIKLGTPKQMQSLLIKNIGIDFFIAGSFFLMGIFYMVIFFYFTKRLATLYFSLFCLLLAVRPLVTGELAITYITNWNWVSIEHAEFISFYFAIPVLSLFSYELFPKEFSKKLLLAILFISLPFGMVAIFASPFIFTYVLRPFQVIMILCAVYGLYVYVKAVKNQRPGSIYFLTGFIILFIAVINDLLYSSLIIQSVNLVYFGLFVLVISQAIALARQFFRAYGKQRILNNQLELINTELNQKNSAIKEANDQLTRLNSELDILVSRTSHDLRSPITSVVALIHLIKEEKDAANREGFLEMQRRTLHRLNLLITDILEFSRNKRTLLKFEPVDFTELLNFALQDLRFSDNSAHIERIGEVNQDVIFISDKSRLNMILYNLISNGLKYHDRTKINPYIKVAINVTDREAEIKVIDNGNGIDEHHVKHIFEMFYRANDASGSTGLGLYIVSEAVKKLGGAININSTPGEGSTFTVVIPNELEHH